MSKPEIISAASAYMADVSKLPKSFVYLPEGSGPIDALIGGEPGTREVTVDASVAEAMQKALSERLKSTIRPFMGFDHASGKRSFLPQKFAYQDGKGLMVEGRWTKAGRESVEGEDYEYFSPTFLLSEDGKPAGLPDVGEIGSLVNEPAFRNMPSVMAAALNLATRSTDDGGENDGQANVMSTPTTPDQPTKTAVGAADPNEVAELKRKLEEANNELSEIRSKKVTAALEAAEKDGRIAPKDETVKAFWKNNLERDFEGASAMLDKLPKNPALNGDSLVAGRHSGRRPDHPADAQDFGKRQRDALAEVRAQYPNATHDQAWSIARRKNPELFVQTVEA